MDVLTLIGQTRRFMGDWPEEDQLTASIANSSVTTITVADATRYSPGWLIQVDQEAMFVVTGVGTTVTVRRGVRGSVAINHANAATILIRPHFLDLEYFDALNLAVQACWPWIYRPIADENTFTTSGVYEYTLPNANGTIAAVSELQFKETGDLAFRTIHMWDVIRGTLGGIPKIRLRRDLPPGVLRIMGYGVFDLFNSFTSGALSNDFPIRGYELLPLYAAQHLLASGEARRAREDTGARDDRENANRPGGSSAIAQALLQRFQLRLTQTGMPPLPKHVKSVI